MPGAMKTADVPVSWLPYSYRGCLMHIKVVLCIYACRSSFIYIEVALFQLIAYLVIANLVITITSLYDLII